MPIESILLGISLAATAGLRVFMPFMFVGAMARYAHTPAPAMLSWTATDAGFLLLLVATLLEILADKIPVVDNALDAAASFLKPAAGFFLPVAMLYHFSPMGAWVLGIAAGAPLAFGVYATKAGTRAVSTSATVGTANPIISVLEDVWAAAILVLSVLAPIVSVLLVVLLVVLVVRAVSRMRRWLRRSETPRSA